MKHILKIICITLVLWFPTHVFAATITELECDKDSLLSTESTECRVKLTSDHEQGVLSAEMYLRKGSYIDISNVALYAPNPNSNNWQGDLSPKEGETDPYIAVYGNNPVRGSFILVTFTITAQEVSEPVDTNVYLENISIREGYDYDTNQTTELSVSRPISISDVKANKDANNELEYIRIINLAGKVKTYKFIDGTLHNTINYSLFNNDDSITIEAKSLSDKATVSGQYGKLDLTDGLGKNTFTIIVIAENGESKNYTVNINKRDANDPIGSSDDTESSEDKANSGAEVEPTPAPVEETPEIKNPKTSGVFPIFLLSALVGVTTFTLVFKRKNIFKKI